MREITTTRDIDGTPEQVWAVLTDLASYPEWNPFLTRAAGTVAPGETLTITFSPQGGRAMVMRPVVDDAEPARLLRWTGHLLVRGIFDGRHSFALTPLDGGRTRLVQSERFTGILVPLVGRLLAGTERSFTALNDALAARVSTLRDV